MYDACTSGTYRVLTVASLHRLKMEAFILAPADCEVRFVIKFLNAQSIAPIEILRQLCKKSFSAPCCTKLSQITCGSQNCTQYGRPKQLTPEHKAKRMESALTTGSIFSYTSRYSCSVNVSVYRMAG